MKVILVMNMPENCNNCIFCDHDWWCLVDKEERRANDEHKPEWCPLKPLPDKYTYYLGGDYTDGWNACIDEICEVGTCEVEI